MNLANRSHTAIGMSVVASCLGLMDASFIVGEHLWDRYPLCSDAGPCERLSLGPISGLWVAIAGMLYYGILLFLSFSLRSTGGGALAKRTHLLSVLGCCASLALMAYAILERGLFCELCALSCVLSSSIPFFLSYADHERTPPPRRPSWRAILVGGLGVGLAIAASLSLPGLMGSKALFDARAIGLARPTDLAPPDSLVYAPSGSTSTRVVMFIDVDCPVCKTTLPATIDLANLYHARLVVRDLPLSIHENARRHCETFEQANQQGKGWQLLESVSSRPSLSDAEFYTLSRRLGILDASEGAKTRVGRDEKLARRLGIRGTPCLIVLREGSRAKPVLGLRDLESELRIASKL